MCPVCAEPGKKLKIRLPGKGQITNAACHEKKERSVTELLGSAFCIQLSVISQSTSSRGKGLTAAGRAEKELGESEVTERGMEWGSLFYSLSSRFRPIYD